MSPHHPRKARQPTAGPRPADEESNIGLLPHHVLRDKSSSEGRIGEEEDHSRFKIPSIPKEKMIIWRISIILLFIIPACLLYLITCSDPSWRTNWSVVKVHLPSQEWGIISSKGRQLGRSYTANITKRAEENGEEADNAETEDGGWLSVNMWGWCLQGISKTETICSSEDMLFDLDELLGSKPASSTPSSEDFNFILTHGLILHGIAMVVSVIAVVPMILATYRTICAVNPTVESSWFEHGSLLIGCALCLIAYIIDRSLVSSVQDNLESHKVTTGQAVIVNGVACVLLTLTFLFSSLPPFYFHMKRQTQLARFLEDGEDEEGYEGHMQDLRDQGRPHVIRSGTQRCADMLFSNKKSGERDRRKRPRRKGTLTRWTSRGRRRGGGETSDCWEEKGRNRKRRKDRRGRGRHR